MLTRLLGRLLLLVVLVLGVWFVISNYHGTSTYGCTDTAGAVAHAAEDCPTGIGQAASDPSWAAARIADINTRVAGNTKPYTYGEYYDPDGTSHWYASGRDTDADTARDVGRQAGLFPASGTVATVDHVEVKVAAQMRRSGTTSGVLVINNPAGPCGQDTKGMYSCTVVVPKLLPAEASLVVWWPGRDARHPDHETFPGGAR